MNYTPVFHNTTKKMSFYIKQFYKLVKSNNKKPTISDKPKPNPRRNPKPLKTEFCFGGPINIQHPGRQRIPWPNDDAERAVKERRCN